MSRETTPVSGKAALPVLQLDPRTYDRALGCVHCGLCLPACPTYTTTGHEADSPRGRIQLIKGLADGTVPYSRETQEHLDLCLDCRACETACPSEVVYHELIEEARTRLSGVSSVVDTPDRGAKPVSTETPPLLRWFFFHVLTRPVRLKLALLPVRVLQKVGVYGLLRRSGLVGLSTRMLGRSGEAFAKLEAMLPEGPVWPGTIAAVTSPSLGSVKRVRVAFFGTCVGSVMFSRVNRMSVELLSACGAEVVSPGGQGCCGAIHHHNADEHTAADLARQNIDALLGSECDYIVSSVAGCGAQLREYAHVLRDDPAYAARARTLVAKVRDVSEVLLELGLPPHLKPVAGTATYHDACHLAHAQRVTSAPRKLLARVPGLKLVPLRESDMCCGAAGTYNLTQPQMARQLAERKLSHVDATSAELLISSNAGCTLHLSGASKQRGKPLRVLHPVEVLHAAVFGKGK